MKQENKPIEEILEKLGLSVNDISLYERAFTHKSFLNESTENKNLKHNERLEFLGDAVLELIVSEHLFATYQDRPEGELTSFRAATVRTETLADTSRELGYGEYLRMSRGEEATGGREKDYLMANTFESVLGAIYLDKGYEDASAYIHRVLIPKLKNIVANRTDIDAKTKFQEVAQAKFRVTPEYRVVSETGPDHDKVFIMGAYLDTKKIAEGSGSSKQRAEEKAAAAALEKLDKKE